MWIRLQYELDDRKEQHEPQNHQQNRTYSQIVIVHVLLGNGHVRVVLQVRAHPVDGVIDFRPCAQRILGLAQRIYNWNNADGSVHVIGHTPPFSTTGPPPISQIT